MAYNIEFKLEKLNRCRQFMREFSLYGLSNHLVMKENRSAYNQFLGMMTKWLKAYACKCGYKSSTRHFLAMESRDLDENPLAIFFKSKEILGSEMAAHFGLLFALADGQYKTVAGLQSQIPVDNKRLWAVLKDYEALGLIERKTIGNRFEFRMVELDFDLKSNVDAIGFFSEVDPLGVTGHFLKDRYRAKFRVLPKTPFRYRYKFWHHLTDAEILETLLVCIKNQTPVRVRLYHWIQSHDMQYKVPANYTLVDAKGNIVNLDSSTTKCWLSADVIPEKIYSSVQTGRRYVMGYYVDSGEFAAIRIDRIEEATAVSYHKQDVGTEDNNYKSRFTDELRHIWGVSTKNAPKTVHVEFEIMDSYPASPVLKRLEAEKRCGTIERISPYSARFMVDVYDGRELFPWIRSFIGYILNVSFSDDALTDEWEKLSVI